jgi:hypothetical protein
MKRPAYGLLPTRVQTYGDNESSGQTVERIMQHATSDDVAVRRGTRVLAQPARPTCISALS